MLNGNSLSYSFKILALRPIWNRRCCLWKSYTNFSLVVCRANKKLFHDISYFKPSLEANLFDYYVPGWAAEASWISGSNPYGRNFLQINLTIPYINIWSRWCSVLSLLTVTSYGTWIHAGIHTYNEMYPHASSTIKNRDS